MHAKSSKIPSNSEMIGPRVATTHSVEVSNIDVKPKVPCFIPDFPATWMEEDMKALIRSKN